MTYGRFTLEQWEKRGGDPKEGGDPYLEADGRWHRITDFHVAQGLGIVTYQAEECDTREVEAWLRENMKPVAEIAVPQIGAVETTEGARAELQYAAAQRSESTAQLTGAMVEVAQQKDDEGDAGAAVPANPLPGGGQGGAEAAPPKLTDFARDHGWPGTGRISNAIKQQYQEEYPD